MNPGYVSPEQVSAVINACSPEELDDHIVHLQNAEDALQKAAYENDELSYMFRFAYDLKLMREKCERLQKTLGYETDRQ